jgi:hypothetical protein
MTLQRYSVSSVVGGHPKDERNFAIVNVSRNFAEFGVLLLI